MIEQIKEEFKKSGELTREALKALSDSIMIEVGKKANTTDLTELKSRIDFILEGTDADTDQLKELVALMNNLDSGVQASIIQQLTIKLDKSIFEAYVEANKKEKESQDAKLDALKSLNFSVYKRGLMVYSSSTSSSNVGLGSYSYKTIVLIPVIGVDDGEQIEVRFNNLRNFHENTSKNHTGIVKNNLCYLELYANSASRFFNGTAFLTYAGKELSVSISSYNISSPRSFKSNIDFTGYTDPSSYTIGTKFSELATKDFITTGKRYNDPVFNSFKPENFTEKGLALNNRYSLLLLGDKKRKPTCDFGKSDYEFLLEYSSNTITTIPEVIVSRYNGDLYSKDLADRGFVDSPDDCVFNNFNDVTVGMNKSNYLIRTRGSLSLTDLRLQPKLGVNGISVVQQQGYDNFTDQMVNFDRKNDSTDFTFFSYYGISAVFNAVKSDPKIMDKLQVIYLPIDLNKEFTKESISTNDSNYTKQHLGLNVINGTLKTYYEN